MIFKMNKKADSSILVIIFELLIVAIVVFTTVSVAHAYGNSLITQKVNLAEDIRMMSNTLAGVPGDAVVQYPANVSQFNVILRKNSVTVYEKGDSSAERVVRNFYLPQGYDAFGTLQGEDKLCLEKRGKIIILRRCGVVEQQKEEQPIRQIPEGPSFFGLEILEDPVVFVIDRSGSMDGDSGWVFPEGVDPPGEKKIDVAKWQLKQVLQGIEDGKKFNIVFFDIGVSTFKSGLVELNAQSREEAFNFIDTFEPGLSTNTGAAVQKALSLGEIEGIYLLSDGGPDVVPRALAQIKNANAVDKAKINTIAIFTKIPADASGTHLENLQKVREEGRSFLQQIADESGGRFITHE